jgi:hypothetical protein
MKPSFLNLFTNKLTRVRVVPIISASVSCDTFSCDTSRLLPRSRNYGLHSRQNRRNKSRVIGYAQNWLSCNQSPTPLGIAPELRECFIAGAHSSMKWAWRDALARVRKNRLKVAAGGCGGCGLMAGPGLTAMGIESFFACSLLILHDLGKSEKSENRS